MYLEAVCTLTSLVSLGDRGGHPSIILTLIGMLILFLLPTQTPSIFDTVIGILRTEFLELINETLLKLGVMDLRRS